jgi:hypothetical protein
MRDLLDTRLDVVRFALDVANDPDEPGSTTICWGPPRCHANGGDGEELSACPWCYRVPPLDPRSPGQVLLDMDRRGRGH